MHWETKKICVTLFMAKLAFLQWSRTEHTMSLRYACISISKFDMRIACENLKIFYKSKRKGKNISEKQRSTKAENWKYEKNHEKFKEFDS